MHHHVMVVMHHHHVVMMMVVVDNDDVVGHRGHRRESDGTGQNGCSDNFLQHRVPLFSESRDRAAMIPSQYPDRDLNGG